jgi:hypothetical protein
MDRLKSAPDPGRYGTSVDAGGIQAHLVPGKMALLVVSIGLRVLEPASRMRSVTVQTLVAVGPDRLMPPLGHASQMGV